MVKLFAINIPLAVACVMRMAIKQERNKCSGLHWRELAEDIARGYYASPKQVTALVNQYPFLRPYQR